MTIGDDVFFKSGKFDVTSARGLALLGHELTHVAQQQTSDWRNPAVSRSAEHQERSARANERFVLARAQSPMQRQGLCPNRISSPLARGFRGGGMPLTTGLKGNSSSASILPSTSASARPMFADESRDLSALPDIEPEEANAMMLSESEMSRIKEEVYKDLMLRIKIDFERGA